MRTITKDNAAELAYVTMVKVGTTRMAPLHVSEPTTVETKEGAYELPIGWKGAIALDADDDPYPIEQSVIERSYRPVEFEQR